jgi:hypothetical protein
VSSLSRAGTAPVVKDSAPTYINLIEDSKPMYLNLYDIYEGTVGSLSFFIWTGSGWGKSFSNVNLYVTVRSNDTLEFLPKEDMYGKDTITVNATNQDQLSTNHKINVTVYEINDAPIINVKEPQIAYQDKKHYINITANDPADPHDSYFALTTNDTELDLDFTFVKNADDNFSFSFTPTNADIGFYYLNISAFDTKDYRYKTLEIEVINVNDKPEKPILILPESVENRIFNTTDLIEFEATAYDPDLKWGDNLSWSWVTDISQLFIGGEARFKTQIVIGGHHNITITVVDEFKETSSSSFSIYVIDPTKAAVPQIELISPKNNGLIPSTTSTIQVTFTWEPRTHEYSDLFAYNLEYWENDPNTVGTKIKGLKETKYTLTAIVETTYYWTVIPTLGGENGIIGQCYSGTWSFVVKLFDCPPCTDPKVELISPLPDYWVGTSSLELRWESDDEYADYYTYSIILDENPIPKSVIETDLDETSYMLNGLEDGKTYYWDVVPVFGEYVGKSTNGPFMFTVDSHNCTNPNITIEPDEFEFTMHNKQSKNFVYTIKNTGYTIERRDLESRPH